MKKKKIIKFSLKKWLLNHYKKPGFNKKISSLNLYNPLFIEAANQGFLKKAVKQDNWIDQCVYNYFSTVVNLSRCIDESCHDTRIMKPRINYYTPVKILKLLFKLQEAFNNNMLFENFLHFKGVFEGCCFFQVTSYPIALFSKQLCTSIKYPGIKTGKYLVIEIPELQRDPGIEGIICPPEDEVLRGLQSDNSDDLQFNPVRFGKTPWAIFENILTGITSIDTTLIPVINCKKNPWVEFLDKNSVTPEMIGNAEKCVNDGNFINQWVKDALTTEDLDTRQTRIDDSIVNFPAF